MNESKTKLLRLLLIVWVVVFVSSCASIGAPHDPKTEDTLFSLNTKTSEIFISLEKSSNLPEQDYKYFVDVYKAIHLDLSNLELRASAIPRNDKTQRQIVLLTKSVKQLEELHQTGFGKSSFGKQESIKVSKNTMKQILRAMLKLERAKQRGVVSSKETTEKEG